MSTQKKVNTQSEDVDKDNFLKFKEIFPQFVRDCEIDFDNLQKFFKEEGYMSEGEKYGLSWAGRSEAFRALRTPSTGTLSKDENRSVDFSKTENIFIEGDNLEVLKLLQKNYREKIKMIYIDPPYNTGKDFVYKDNFIESVADYYEKTGQSKDGVKMSVNTEKNGRFHSDWLTMMYPRLFLARNLLKEDGVIFISIDDNEVANLRLICDEIFGGENFISQFIWHKKLTGGYDNKWINNQHEYVLFYAKNKDRFDVGKILAESKYTLIDQNGKKFKWDSLWTSSLTYSKSLDYEITAPDGTKINPIGTRGKAFWLWGKDKSEKDRNLLNFKKDKNGEWKVYKRVYASEDGLISNSILDKEVVNGNSHSAKEMGEIFGERIFDYSKPINLIKYLIKLGNLSDNECVLDFFAGSGTTAHGVMDLNAEDGGDRKWICVQIPEMTDEDGEAYKAGYKKISDIAVERIKRAGKKIKEENKEKEGIEKKDFGFKVFKLEKSNFRKWQTVIAEKTEEELLEQAKLFADSPLVDDFKEVDVLSEIFLKEGFGLNSKIEEKENKDLNIKYFIVRDAESERCMTLTFQLKISKKIMDFLETQLPKDSLFVCFDSALDDTLKANISRNFNLKVI